MKKNIILLTLFLVLINTLLAGAKSFCSDYKKILNLSAKQINNIEAVERYYNTKIAKLNAEIILRKMEASQLKGIANQQSKIHALNTELGILNDELEEIQAQKEKEIISDLGFIQRIKYKKYCR